MANQRTRKSYVAFNAGEMSPKLDARVDTEKYAKGCRIMQNMIPMPHGGVTRRKGFEFIAAAKFPDKPCRLIDFQFSRDEALIIEVGDLYMRFFYNGQPVMDPDTPTIPYEIESPYSASEAFELQYVQIQDVSYIAHDAHPPHKLSRFAIDNWTLEPVDWDWPPFLPENITETTLNPSAVTGTGIIVTASPGLWVPEMVGSFFEISHRRGETSVTRDINGNASSPVIVVQGGYTISTSGTWTATVNVERTPDDGNVSPTWEIIHSFDAADNRNINQTFDSPDRYRMRIRISNYSSNTNGLAILEVADAFVHGIVKIVGVTSDMLATADVIVRLGNTTATRYWREGAWSEYRGYPAAVAFFQQRIYYGGSIYQPQNFWGSALDDFQNFLFGTDDDDAFTFQISSEERNQIIWMVAQNVLAIGTTGGEWSARGSELNETISPTNIVVTKQSNFGSSIVRPLLVNDAILFVQRNGRKVREMVYDDLSKIFKSSDLTILSDQITAGDIRNVSYQSDRDSIYWAVTGHGNLIGMTYEKEQQVIAWHRHNTQGFFESVETIYGTTDDEVWVCVKRLINGNTVRYIERFTGYYNPSVDSDFGVNVRVNVSGFCIPREFQWYQVNFPDSIATVNSVESTFNEGSGTWPEVQTISFINSEAGIGRVYLDALQEWNFIYPSGGQPSWNARVSSEAVFDGSIIDLSYGYESTSIIIKFDLDFIGNNQMNDNGTQKPICSFVTPSPPDGETKITIIIIYSDGSEYILLNLNAVGSCAQEPDSETYSLLEDWRVGMSNSWRGIEIPIIPPGGKIISKIRVFSEQKRGWREGPTASSSGAWEINNFHVGCDILCPSPGPVQALSFPSAMLSIKGEHHEYHEDSPDPIVTDVYQEVPFIGGDSCTFPMLPIPNTTNDGSGEEIINYYTTFHQYITNTTTASIPQGTARVLHFDVSFSSNAERESCIVDPPNSHCENFGVCVGGMRDTCQANLSFRKNSSSGEILLTLEAEGNCNCTMTSGTEEFLEDFDEDDGVWHVSIDIPDDTTSLVAVCDYFTPYLGARGEWKIENMIIN